MENTLTIEYNGMNIVDNEDISTLKKYTLGCQDKVMRDNVKIIAQGAAGGVPTGITKEYRADPMYAFSAGEFVRLNPGEKDVTLKTWENSEALSKGRRCIIPVDGSQYYFYIGSGYAKFDEESFVPVKIPDMTHCIYLEQISSTQILCFYLAAQGYLYERIITINASIPQIIDIGTPISIGVRYYNYTQEVLKVAERRYLLLYDDATRHTKVLFLTLDSSYSLQTRVISQISDSGVYAAELIAPNKMLTAGTTYLTPNTMTVSIYSFNFGASLTGEGSVQISASVPTQLKIVLFPENAKALVFTLKNVYKISLTNLQDWSSFSLPDFLQNGYFDVERFPDSNEIILSKENRVDFCSYDGSTFSIDSSITYDWLDRYTFSGEDRFGLSGLCLKPDKTGVFGTHLQDINTGKHIDGLVYVLLSEEYVTKISEPQNYPVVGVSVSEKTDGKIFVRVPE